MSLRFFVAAAYTETMINAAESGNDALNKQETIPPVNSSLTDPVKTAGTGETHIRVLIIDGHEAVRRALRIRLSVSPHLEVVGVSSNPDAAAEQIQSKKPDVVLLGLHTSSDDELADMTRAVHGMASTATIVIVLAPYADAIERELLIDAGAKRYFLKHINSDQLIGEIESVVADADPA